MVLDSNFFLLGLCRMWNWFLDSNHSYTLLIPADIPLAWLCFVTPLSNLPYDFKVCHVFLMFLIVLLIYRTEEMTFRGVPTICWAPRLFCLYSCTLCMSLLCKFCPLGWEKAWARKVLSLQRQCLKLTKLEPIFSTYLRPGMMMDTFNPSTRERPAELCAFKASLVYIVMVNWRYTVRLGVRKGDMTVSYVLVTSLHYFCVFSKKILFISYEAVIWHVVNNVRHRASCCCLLCNPHFPGAGVEETRGQRYRLQDIPVQKLKVLYC